MDLDLMRLFRKNVKEKNRKIAFFDSGIGGLTVFQKALHLFPNENYIYFADSDNAPYGSHSKEEVQKLIGELGMVNKLNKIIDN